MRRSTQHIAPRWLADACACTLARCVGDIDRVRVYELAIAIMGVFAARLSPCMGGLCAALLSVVAHVHHLSLPAPCARSRHLRHIEWPPAHFLFLSRCRPPPLISLLVRIYRQQMVMRQRMDAHDSGGGGVFDTYEKLRQANSDKLQTLLSRTARGRGAAGGAARHVKKSASLTGDYLDFENDEFADKWINIGMGLMVALALFLFYVLWFTDWVQ